MRTGLIQRLLSQLTIFIEPSGLHLKAIALGGVLFSFDWRWLALLALTLLTCGVLMVTLLGSHARASIASALSRLDPPHYWKKVSLSGINVGAWRQDIAAQLRLPFLPTESLILTPKNRDEAFREPEAFISAHAFAVILLPSGYDAASPIELKPLKRFTLLHEVAHSTLEGTFIWGARRIVLPSFVLAFLTLWQMPNGPPNWILSLAMVVLGILILLQMSKVAAKICAELHADSQALEWMASYSVDDALSVVRNRRIVWGTPPNLVFLQRCRNMVTWSNFLERVVQNRLVVRPRITLHAMLMPWTQYFTALALLFGMGATTPDDAKSIEPILIGLVACLMACTVFYRYERNIVVQLRTKLHSRSLEVA